MDVSRALLGAMDPRPRYAFFSLSYARWYHKDYGPGFYKTLFDQNKEFTLLVDMSDVPVSEMNWAADRLAEFPQIRAISPCNELPAWEDSAKAIFRFRAALPKARIGFPSLWCSWNPPYMESLIRVEALQEANDIWMHDYKATPGNGHNDHAGRPDLWSTMPRVHPDNDANDGTPNTPKLEKRLELLQEYAKLCRKDFVDDIPNVMLTEYGLFSEAEPAEAKRTVEILTKKGVPAVLSDIVGPVGWFSFSQAIYEVVNGVTVGAHWTPAMNAFLAALRDGMPMTVDGAVAKLNEARGNLEQIEWKVKRLKEELATR